MSISMSTRRIILSNNFLLASSALWLATSAHAADQPPQPSPVTATSASGDNGASGDIVVTATKRPETNLNVPISLSVLDSGSLQRQNVVGVSDLAHSVPSLFLQQRGNLQSAFTIRGVGGDPRNIGLQSGVAVTIDGVTAGRSNGYDTDLLQIQQVEILRGPQGTLFGTNTIGGVINITTRRPDENVQGTVKLGYGRFDAFRAAASLSGPISETLFVGATVQRLARDGYIHNTLRDVDLQDQDRISGRLQLRWVPSDSIELYITGDATRDRTHAALSQLLPPYTSYAATNPPASRYVAAMDQRNSDNRDIRGTSATFNYDFGEGYSLTYVGAYRSVKTLVYSDGDNAPVDLIHSGPFTDHSKTLSQEVRLVSPGDKPFRYVTGIFFQNEKASSARNLYINGTLAAGASTFAKIRTNSYAAYANANYDLMDQLTLTGGLRYNIEDKDGSYRQLRQNLPALSFDFPHIGRKDKALSWMTSLLFKPTNRLSGYATISRGYKSGGFNVDLASDPNTTPARLAFEPEHLTNYELGVKGNLFNGRVQLAASIFRQIYRDRQVSQFVGSGGGIPAIYITNAGASRTDGIEAEGTFHIPGGPNLNLSFSHLDAHYTSFPNATSAGASFTGHVTELTPNYTGTISLDQRVPLGSGHLVYNAAARYTGKTYFDAANVALNTQDGFWLFDARTGYEFEIAGGAQTIGVYAWGKNLSGRDYLVFSRQYSGATQGLYGEPRTYGVELSLSF